MHTIKLYMSGQNPDLTIDVDLAELTAESVAVALHDAMHDCDGRTMLRDVVRGECSTEERPDLTVVPGERCFVYYMLPACECEPGTCNCEGDIFIATAACHG